MLSEEERHRLVTMLSNYEKLLEEKNKEMDNEFEEGLMDLEISRARRMRKKLQD